MAYDEILTDRIRKQLRRRKGLVEKKMFGGVCFLVNGNMCCGVIGNELIIRVKPEQASSLLTRKGTRVFDFTGKPSKNMLYIGHNVLQSDAELKEWLTVSLNYARSLPPK